MIKRYLALSLVTASLVMAGCSSSDDDDPTTTTPKPEEMTPKPEETTPAECADCANATDTIVGTAGATADLSTLVEQIGIAGITVAATAESPFMTVFAPNNDAFAAVDADTLTNLSVEDRAELLNYHVVPNSALKAADLTDGAMLTTASGKALPISVGADGAVSIGGATVVTADIAATDGIVHIIDTVLTVPADAPVETTPPDTTTPATDGIVAALEADGGYGLFLAAFKTDFGGVEALSDAANQWTIFAPTDTVLGGTALAAEASKEYINANGNLDPAALAALSGQTIKTSGTNDYAVEGAEGAITVNGHAVTELTKTDTITVYSIAGTMP